MASRTYGITGPLIGIAVGFLFFWCGWATWEEFRQLESGELATMRVPAPIAWIYNLGGIGSTIAKWLLVALLASIGLYLVVGGTRGLFAKREAAGNESQLDG